MNDNQGRNPFRWLFRSSSSPYSPPISYFVRFATRLILVSLLGASFVPSFGHSLPPGVKGAAERFFGTGFDGVTIAMGAEPRQLGAVAFTYGDQITLADNLKATPGEWLELLGHELAHVVQQREGRVPVTMTLGRHAANADAALEQEAGILGAMFAGGVVWSGRMVSPGAARSRPVVQRAVEIGGRPLTNPGQLSSGAKTVLAFIDGGVSWLDWSAQSTTPYSFPDESSMLTQIQSGLHGTPIVLLRGIGLQIHPARLMAMPLDDLHTVSRWNASAQDVAQDFEGIAILSAAQLRRDKDLTAVQSWLSELALSGNALFQALSLSDLVALYNLINAVGGDSVELQQEAAAFALKHAQSPMTFVDSFQFYVAVNAANGALPPAGRSARAEVMWTSLLPLLWPYLDGPVLPAGGGQAMTLQELEGWLRQGRVLGFSRVSLAAAQVAMSGALGDGSQAGLAQEVRQYMAAAQALLAQGGSPTVSLSQDGKDSLYTFHSGSALATVCVDANGDTSLVAFQPH